MGFDPLQWLATRLSEALNALSGPLQPLVSLVMTMPLELTTRNTIVMQGWTTLVAVSDALLGLIVVIGTIQMMYGQQTGTLYLPVGQFLAKAIVTAVLIHLSGFLGQELLLFNNQLDTLVPADAQAFARLANAGQNLNQGQLLILATVLTVVFGIGFIRILFQAVKRIIRFNLLFVLSGPAFLASLHPYSAPFFSAWARLYVTTIFEQFVQFLTLGLGLQFLLATHQTGFTGFVLACAMLYMTAEIPRLLERFGAAATGGAQGSALGSLVRTAVSAALLFG